MLPPSPPSSLLTPLPCPSPSFLILLPHLAIVDLSYIAFQKSEPFCQPYGNRRLLHCVPKGHLHHLEPHDPSLSEGEQQHEKEIPAWEACGKVITMERNDYWEFVVSSSPSFVQALEVELNSFVLSSPLPTLLVSRHSYFPLTYLLIWTDSNHCFVTFPSSLSSLALLHRQPTSSSSSSRWSSSSFALGNSQECSIACWQLGLDYLDRRRVGQGGSWGLVYDLIDGNTLDRSADPRVAMFEREKGERSRMRDELREKKRGRKSARECSFNS